MKNGSSPAFYLSSVISLLLLGAGCSSFTPTAPTSFVGDSGTPSPEGLIAYSQGFGLLPGKNPNTQIDRTKSSAEVTWKDLPEIPPTVTVIRKRSTVPNSTVIQNLTSALNVPVGALGQNPSAKAMVIDWDDQAGFRWSYDATTDRLSFERELVRSSLTSSKTAADDVLEKSAIDFMSSKGIQSTDWSAPYVVYSWDQWWSARQKEGKCMTRASLDIVRKMAFEGSLDYDLISSLSKSGSSDCVDPEFPNQQVVRFSVSKDGLSIYEKDGMPAIGGEAVVRLDTQEVIRGWVELKREADRSNYESIQPDRLEYYLKTGGVLGFPPSTKSYAISSFHRGSYRYVTEANGEQRTFYIPAIQAEGILTYQNGSSLPYAIVVPLTREDQFEGK